MRHLRRLLLGSVCGVLACGVFACEAPEGYDGPGSVTAPNASYEVSPDNRYIVKFRPATERARPGAVNPAGVRAVEGIGATIVRTLERQNAVAMVVSADQLPRLFNDPSVEDIEVDRRRKKLSLEDTEETPYGISMVQADQVSDSAAANRTVCIIDSGFSLGHEDLPGIDNVTGAPDGGAGPWDEDGDGHGTHVAGTIAAIGGNGLGVVGVMPGETVNLRIVRVFGDDGIWAYTSDLVAALAQCDDPGADVFSDVISMSLGGPDASLFEEQAFADAYADGKLPIAAASNDENSSYSYPASYDTVVSVAAIDQFMKHAPFSNWNDQVELAAPGVAVRSTFPTGKGTDGLVAVGADTYTGYPMEGSAFTDETPVKGALVDCGLGTKRCNGAAGGICLVERGGTSFSTMARNCSKAGGVGLVVFNNVAGPLSGTTLGTAPVEIPVVGVSQADGVDLLGSLGAETAVSVEHGNYEYLDGTSMATPHVAAVAALVWSQDTSRTNAEIREALDQSALDLGDDGRDIYFGFGLVQAQDAVDYLAGMTPCVPAGSEICDSGADEDCDGLIDCDDPECAGIAGCPVPPEPESACNDGIDNDGDGLVDCDDGDCSAALSCQTENCTNGVDDNGNGDIDCDDSDCENDSSCIPAGEGTQCTQCESAYDCADGFECVWLGGEDHAYCLQACGKKGTACADEYSCVKIVGGPFGERCISCEPQP